MMAEDPSMYISLISYELGSPRELSSFTDPDMVFVRDRAVADGFEVVHLFDEEPWQLGARAAMRSLSQYDADVPLLIFSSVSPESPTGTTLFQLRSEIGMVTASSIRIGGDARSNFWLAARAARAMGDQGDLSGVLYVTADGAQLGHRVASDSGLVFSDGAAACLMLPRPFGPSFRIDGIACVEVGSPLEVKAVAGEPRIREIGAALTALCTQLGSELSAFKVIITTNIGGARREAMAAAIGRFDPQLFPKDFRRVGQCFSADPLINLSFSTESGAVVPGDPLLLVVDMPDRWAALALEFQA